MTDESWYVVPARQALHGTAKPQGDQQDDGSSDVFGQSEGSLLGQGADKPEPAPLYVRPTAGRRRQRTPRPPTPLQEGGGPQHAGAMKLASGGAPGGAAGGSSGTTPRDQFHGLHPKDSKSKRGRVDFIGRPATVSADAPILHLVPDGLRVLPPLSASKTDDEDEKAPEAQTSRWQVES